MEPGLQWRAILSHVASLPIHILRSAEYAVDAARKGREKGIQLHLGHVKKWSEQLKVIQQAYSYSNQAELIAFLDDYRGGPDECIDAIEKFLEARGCNQE